MDDENLRMERTSGKEPHAIFYKTLAEVPTTLLNVPSQCIHLPVVSYCPYHWWGHTVAIHW